MADENTLGHSPVHPPVQAQNEANAEARTTLLGQSAHGAEPGRNLYERWLRARGVPVHDMWERQDDEYRAAWNAIAATGDGMLADAIRSFLSSAPYTAPEALGDLIRRKLMAPLHHYEQVTRHG